jgi:pimeloyl-ACP methyl ester carboxylesterase
MIKFKYLVFVCLFTFFGNAVAEECVVLLHGLARSASSMKALEARLISEGYQVSNIDYPSRNHTVEILAALVVRQGIQQCTEKSASKINFITHSLGGILVRVYLKSNKRDDIGRVVMLGPPNQGSEVVDNLKDTPGFELLNGPAGMELGTSSADIPKSLGPVEFELGVIAGTQSINLILSTFLPGPNDGKVSVESTRVEGMTDFIALPTTHPFMMKNKTVMDQAIYFLKHGKFDKESLSE